MSLIPIISPKKWKNRYSMQFDGVNEYINIDGVLTPLATTTVGTWSAWVRLLDATPATVGRFIGFGDTDAERFLNLWINTTGTLGAGVGNLGVKWLVETNSAVFSDNTWTHIALIQDAVSPVLYFNGTAVAQTFSNSTDKTYWFSDFTTLDSANISLLKYLNSSIGYVSGQIDEIGFFNTNLSSAQITEIYNGGKPKNLLKHSAVGNLVAYFRNGDGDAFIGGNWTLFDKKGTNNGVSVNMESSDISNIIP